MPFKVALLPGLLRGCLLLEVLPDKPFVGGLGPPPGQVPPPSDCLGGVPAGFPWRCAQARGEQRAARCRVLASHSPHLPPRQTPGLPSKDNMVSTTPMTAPPSLSVAEPPAPHSPVEPLPAEVRALDALSLGWGN